MQDESPSLLIDLHRHLDGNIRVQTIIDLAEQYQVALPSYDLQTLQKHVFIQDKTSDLLSFLSKLDMGVSVLGQLDACKRIAFENVEDAIIEGLNHVELRFSPNYMAQAFNLPLEAVVEAVVAGVAEANQEYQYNAKLIGILSRSYGVETCKQELQALLSHSKDLVAIDLAGDELGFPAKLFVEHFNKVREASLAVTIHAGEADGPDSIWDAIHLLGATRIGHGVNAYQDPKLMEFIADQKIGIENCILSNYQTGTWLDMKSHPLQTFLDYGIEVFLNTDDPGISNNTLKSEYQLAKDELGLSHKQLKHMQQNALNQAFLSTAEKLLLV
ncbi:adenosine deaminase [Paraglaciecola sp.]|uniref:adenosine deaminase n=1 Tax=Paraglaciecola sp. TaxID=1920173 RepID=UPI003EF7BBE2